MSAPSIPNLLSLRGARGGGRGFGGRRGGGRGGGGPSGVSSTTHDVVIQGTDTDAAVSRLSAVDLGYLDDHFAQYFVPQQPGGPAGLVPPRRLPIINRGTYTRTKGLDRLIDAFLSSSSGGERQIVSLGAGTDTRCLRLFSSPNGKGSRGGLTYHEIDFPAVTSKKLGLVRAIPTLRSILAEPEVDTERSVDDGSSGGAGVEIPSSSSWKALRGQYRCHGRDLRSLAKPDAKPLPGLRTDVPTLLVSECCLCYLEVPDAEGVIKHFADQIPDLSIALYEPIKPDDPFGRQMISNLAARRVRMPTLSTYKGVAEQQSRLKAAGFQNIQTMTVEDIWNRWVSEDEKERVDGLEGLDEVEEWKLLAGHYVVAWAWRGRGLESWEHVATR